MDDNNEEVDGEVRVRPIAENPLDGASSEIEVTKAEIARKGSGLQQRRGSSEERIRRRRRFDTVPTIET